MPNQRGVSLYNALELTPLVADQLPHNAIGQYYNEGNHRPLPGPMLDASTKLALDRTRVAYDRTLLAWIRTATSLITFGFSVYKLFDVLPEAREPRFRLIGAHEFGLLMVVIGLVSLLVATFEYRANIRTLGPEYPQRARPLSLIVAALVALLGVLALITMAMRM